MHQTINCGGKLLDLSQPRIMGIINTTPDSFYAHSRQQTITAALHTAEQMLTDGASVLDVGGMSTRPGAALIDSPTEQQRIVPIIAALVKHFDTAIVSVDTVYGATAQAAAQVGASLINDISAGSIDAQLLPTVAQLQLPYVLTHLQGTPATMQQQPHYQHGVVQEVLFFLAKKYAQLRQLGINDVIIDPGFGFGKTTDHNFALLHQLPTLQALGLPLMVGVSRKGMIWRTLDISPNEALNGTTVLHTLALLGGARLLRTHDPKPAAEAIQLVARYQKAANEQV